MTNEPSPPTPSLFHIPVPLGGLPFDHSPSTMTAGINELQPLLHDIHDQRPYDSECQPSCEHRAVKRPLPAAQLTTLCLLRLSDPIAFTQIFPYVNEMMERFGVATDPSQTGFYSGLVVSHCIPPPLHKSRGLTATSPGKCIRTRSVGIDLLLGQSLR